MDVVLKIGFAGELRIGQERSAVAIAILVNKVTPLDIIPELVTGLPGTISPGVCEICLVAVGMQWIGSRVDGFLIQLRFVCTVVIVIRGEGGKVSPFILQRRTEGCLRSQFVNTTDCCQRESATFVGCIFIVKPEIRQAARSGCSANKVVEVSHPALVSVATVEACLQ